MYQNIYYQLGVYTVDDNPQIAHLLNKSVYESTTKTGVLFRTDISQTYQHSTLIAIPSLLLRLIFSLTNSSQHINWFSQFILNWWVHMSFSHFCFFNSVWVLYMSLDRDKIGKRSLKGQGPPLSEKMREYKCFSHAS